MNRDATPNLNPYQARRRRHDPEDSEAHAHRRDTDAEAIIRLHDRLDDIEPRVDAHDQTLALFADSLKELNRTIGRAADGLEALSNFKGFVLTMKLFSGAAKIMLPVLAVVAAVVLFIKTGHWSAGS